MFSAGIGRGLGGFNFHALPIKLFTSVIVGCYMRIKFKHLFIEGGVPFFCNMPSKFRMAGTLARCLHGLMAERQSAVDTFISFFSSALNLTCAETLNDPVKIKKNKLIEKGDDIF